MFEAPLDAWYVWVGVAVVSVVALAAVLSLPSATPPDATAAARTVDGVAVDPPGSTATHALAADRIRLRPHRIDLAGAGGTAHATFAYGPIVPALGHGSLSAVARGARPDRTFADPAGFAGAIQRARNRSHDWREAPARLTVRRVSWGDVDATLVA